MSASNLSIGQGAEDDQDHGAFGQFPGARNRLTKALGSDHVGGSKEDRHQHTSAADKKNHQRQSLKDPPYCLHGNQAFLKDNRPTDRLDVAAGRAKDLVDR